MPRSKAALNKKAKQICLVGMDVDGVLTGGEIVVLDNGEEIKFWNAKDRLILAYLTRKMKDLEFVWITGRTSKAVDWAAQDLGIRDVVQGCHDKKKAFDRILKKRNLSYAQAAFIGDDLIDLGVLKRVGFSACPRDASSDVQKIVDYVSPIPGGRGVVRDLLEFILKAQRKWDPIVKRFLS